MASSNIRFFVYNAFAAQAFGGNPAGIVPQADALSIESMQAIARQLNLVETVFVSELDKEKASCRLRYFTPREELPIAGHPTVAAFTALKTENYFAANSAKAEVKTSLGALAILYEGDKTLMQQLPVKMRAAKTSVDDVAEACGLNAADIDTSFPFMVSDAGLGHVVVAVKSLATLLSATNDIAATAKVTATCGAREMQIFCREAKDASCQFHTRNFVPYVSTEDPACGNGNAALGAYLFAQKTELAGKTLRIEQGHATQRPSVIEVTQRDGNIFIGGHAVKMVAGEVYGAF